jgi:hypothetical protein
VSPLGWEQVGLAGGWQAGGRRVAGGWQAGGRRVAGGWQAAGRRLAGGWQAGGRRGWLVGGTLGAGSGELILHPDSGTGCRAQDSVRREQATGEGLVFCAVGLIIKCVFGKKSPSLRVRSNC